MINELSIKESRPYVIDYLQNGDLTGITAIHITKLYFFISFITDTRFLIEADPRLEEALKSHLFFKEKLNNLQNVVNNREEYNKIYRKYEATVREIVGTQYKTNTQDKVLDTQHVPLDNIKICNAIDELFIYETRMKSEDGPRGILHAFTPPVPVPGEFTVYRNEYENIRFMCYVENFRTKYDEIMGIFHVRNTDGTLIKVSVISQQYKNNLSNFVSNDNNIDYIANGKQYNQHNLSNFVSNDNNIDYMLDKVIGLIYGNTTSHELEKLGWGAPPCQREGSVIIHSPFVFSADSAIKHYITKKALPMHKLWENHIKHANEPRLLTNLSASMRWQHILRDELIDRISNPLDYYVFRHKFIKSYASVIAVQYMLGLCQNSYPRTYIDRATGKVHVASSTYFAPKFNEIKHDKKVKNNKETKGKEDSKNNEKEIVNETNTSSGDDILYHKKNVHSTEQDSNDNLKSYYNNKAITDSLPLKLTDKLFYIRPNIASIFGNEGINGPLVLITARFAEAFLENPSHIRIIQFFFGYKKATESKARLRKLTYNGVVENSNSPELVVSDMVNPKLSLIEDIFSMPWL